MNTYKADSHGENSTDIILHFWQIIEGPANETAQQSHVTCERNSTPLATAPTQYCMMGREGEVGRESTI